MHEGKPGNAALRSGFKAFRLWRPTPRRWITPGGPPVAGKGKQLFVCRGNPDSSGFPLATLLPNFYLAYKVAEIISGVKLSLGAPVA